MFSSLTRSPRRAPASDAIFHTAITLPPRSVPLTFQVLSDHIGRSWILFSSILLGFPPYWHFSPPPITSLFTFYVPVTRQKIPSSLLQVPEVITKRPPPLDSSPLGIIPPQACVVPFRAVPMSRTKRVKLRPSQSPDRQPNPLDFRIPFRPQRMFCSPPPYP